MLRFSLPESKEEVRCEKCGALIKEEEREKTSQELVREYLLKKYE